LDAKPILVGTKITYLWHYTTGLHCRFPRFTKSGFDQALSQSLTRLGANNVALYQIHHPYQFRSIEYWADEMADAVKVRCCNYRFYWRPYWRFCHNIVVVAYDLQ
jgi:aryl-alcohol dehydrogenase-like predicted oxidoreductase